MNSATDEAMDVDPAEEAEEEVPAVIKVRGAKIGDNFICNLNVEVEGSKEYPEGSAVQGRVVPKNVVKAL